MELWVVARWLLLKSLALPASSVLGRKGSLDAPLIRLGNRLFGAQYPKSLYASYSSYVSGYACSLAPFFDLHEKSSWLEGRTILDLGCGLGQYSELLLDSGAREVVSLDPAQGKLQWRAGNPGRIASFKPVSGLAEALPFRSAVFDAVFSNTVFEHIPDVAAALRELRRVLKPGGLGVLSFNFIHHRGGHHLFPYIHFPWAPWVVSEEALCRHWSEQLARDQEQGLMGYYRKGCVIRSLGQGDEIHLNRLDADRFEELVRQSGFRIVRRRSAEILGRRFPLLLRLRALRFFLSGTIYYVLTPDPGPQARTPVR